MKHTESHSTRIRATDLRLKVQKARYAWIDALRYYCEADRGVYVDHVRNDGYSARISDEDTSELQATWNKDVSELQAKLRELKSVYAEMAALDDILFDDDYDPMLSMEGKRIGSESNYEAILMSGMANDSSAWADSVPDKTEKSEARTSGLQSREDHGQGLLGAYHTLKAYIRNSRNNKTPRECVAIGYVAGRHVEALADSCAGNFVSDAYLRALGLTYKSGHTRNILFGKGRPAFSTLGTIHLPWAFAKERAKSYLVEFDVIPARFCEYAVTLGGKFLAATKTLTGRFKDRILRRSRLSAMPRLFYQGASHVRLKGYCEGARVAALADTCSDLDLLSPEMLAELGYEHDDILTDDEHRVFVELPGGLITRTFGMVRDVEFRFGDGRFEDSYIRNFYILPGLPGEVLIGQDLLWESDAFSKYSDSITEFDGDDVLTRDVPEGIFLNIKLVRQARSLFTRSKKRAADEADLETHKQWEAQCKSVLDEVEDMHRRQMEEAVRKDEILKLEQKYRQLMQSPPKPATPAGRNHRPRPAPPSANSPAMVQVRDSTGHAASTGTANT